EYYMFSISEKELKPLNPAIYMYFSFSADSIAYRQSYLYYNILVNKQKYPDIYDEFRSQMEKYALDQIRKGNINGFLAEIYKNILKPEFIDEYTSLTLPGILCTCEIMCSNTDMEEVIIIHKEKEEENHYRIINGRAYVQIYTKNPCILFVDAYGNRYSSIKYLIKTLLEHKDYLDICLKYHPENEWMMLHFAEEYLRGGYNIVKSIRMFQKIVELNDVSKEYKKQLIKDIIDYYYDNYDNDLIDEYLISLNMDNLSISTRNKVMEIMISRGLYNQVYPRLKEYGYTEIAPRKLARFCTRMIEIVDFEYHPNLLAMAYCAFLESKFDETILQYLQRYYYGTTKEMLDIWIAIESYECDRTALEERIIVQMLFEGNNSPSLFKVFESYFSNGVGTKIKSAVFTYYSYNYFVKGEFVNQKIFDLMEAEFYNTSQMTDICRMAFVYNYSQKNELNMRQVDLCRKIIYKLADMNIVFNFYKKFEKWFDMPYQIIDKTVIDYKTIPRHKVSIHYYIGKEPENKRTYATEEMHWVYPGIFVKEIPLFYGDRIYYYFTETGDDFEKTTDVSMMQVTDKSLFNDENRFNMINHMLIADELGKSEALKQLIDNYDVNMQIVEELFKMV
ncbi:MAG: DUF5717 family protein, partial [Eubacterium sp.]